MVVLARGKAMKICSNADRWDGFQEVKTSRGLSWECGEGEKVKIDRGRIGR